MEVRFNNVIYQFPDEALTGTDAPVTEACVTVLSPNSDPPRTLRYRIWAQRMQGDPYLAAHGCSLCALATLIGAAADPNVTAAFLAETRDALLDRRSARRGRASHDRPVTGGRRHDPKHLPGRLARSSRMPLNIAGADRILSLYTRTELLDGGTDEQIRDFLLSRASRGIPILATGRSIPSVSGADLCPRTTHSFLIIGMKDAHTLIAADSAGLNDERIKFVDIEALISGLYRAGADLGIKKQQFYFTRRTRGGLLSLERPEQPTQV